MTVPITDPLIVDVGRRLAEGGHRYSERQLYHAVCAEIAEPPRAAGRGAVGCGIVLVAVGLALQTVHALRLFWPFVVILGISVVVAGAFQVRFDRRRRALPRPRLLPVSSAEFAEELAGLRERRPGALPELLAAEPVRPPARVARDALLVVCDRDDTVAILAANRGHLPGGVVVITAEAAGRRVRGRDAVAVHDADPQGCALAADLRDAGAARVVDAGLEPPASDADLPVIEGAPARLPRDLSAELSPAAVSWLRSGRRLELASLTPAEICAMVRAALLPATEPASTSS